MIYFGSLAISAAVNVLLVVLAAWLADTSFTTLLPWYAFGWIICADARGIRERT